MTRILGSIVMLWLLAVPAFAQEAPPAQPSKPPTAAAQDGFVPVDAPMTGQDTIPAPRLVAAAYGFIWVVLFGYLWSVRSRLARVEREMETVSRRIAGK
jgi:CcmD family protein